MIPKWDKHDAGRKGKRGQDNIHTMMTKTDLGTDQAEDVVETQRQHSKKWS